MPNHNQIQVSPNQTMPIFSAIEIRLYVAGHTFVSFTPG